MNTYRCKIYKCRVVTFKAVGNVKPICPACNKEGEYVRAVQKGVA